MYDLNDDADFVRLFTIDYIQGNPPLSSAYYPAKTLYKLTTVDEYGKKVIEFTDKSGQLILKKVQLDDVPASAYTGWICTYSIYDDFGLLRYQLQPEAVKYLDANAWSFARANGLSVLNEWCFQYNYDAKGRNVWKKAPGAVALKMIYDNRDRIVFMQDGNQAALATPQWTFPAQCLLLNRSCPCLPAGPCVQARRHWALCNVKPNSILLRYACKKRYTIQ